MTLLDANKVLEGTTDNKLMELLRKSVIEEALTLFKVVPLARDCLANETKLAKAVWTLEQWLPATKKYPEYERIESQLLRLSEELNLDGLFEKLVGHVACALNDNLVLAALVFQADIEEFGKQAKETFTNYHLNAKCECSKCLALRRFDKLTSLAKISKKLLAKVGNCD